jgi:hypothetical protein
MSDLNVIKTLLEFRALTHIAFDCVHKYRPPTNKVIQHLYDRDGIELIVVGADPYHTTYHDIEQVDVVKFVLMDMPRSESPAASWASSIWWDDGRNLWFRGGMTAKKAMEPDPPVSR